MSIFDFITSTEIVAYWEEMLQNEPPYLGEELFPDDQKLGLDLQWLKGATGLPVVLKPSAFDVQAIPRKRIGFEKLTAQMPFFKESKYIDEELRQELNKVLETGNQAYIDIVVNRIFADDVELLRGARAQRERMRMMMLSTGTIEIEGNGQAYTYDYRMPEGHKKTVSVAWSDSEADIIGTIQEGIETIEEDAGVTVTRAICSSKVMGYFRKNNEIKKSIALLTNGEGHISDSKILSFISDELGIEVVKYDKKYIDEDNQRQRFIEDELFIMFPDGDLGTTWFGTTPEQSDLMTSSVANVTITDTGVAVTTMEKADPVQVETKVTQICLPDFPTADQVYIIDTDGE